MEKQHTNRQKNMIIYSAKALNREKRPSVLKQLRTLAAKIAELPGKVVNRDKKRELDR